MAAPSVALHLCWQGSDISWFSDRLQMSALFYLSTSATKEKKPAHSDVSGQGVSIITSDQSHTTP